MEHKRNGNVTRRRNVTRGSLRNLECGRTSIDREVAPLSPILPCISRVGSPVSGRSLILNLSTLKKNETPFAIELFPLAPSLKSVQEQSPTKVSLGVLFPQPPFLSVPCTDALHLFSQMNAESYRAVSIEVSRLRLHLPTTAARLR